MFIPLNYITMLPDLSGGYDVGGYDAVCRYKMIKLLLFRPLTKQPFAASITDNHPDFNQAHIKADLR
jgi:hypothetical protein